MLSPLNSRAIIRIANLVFIPLLGFSALYALRTPVADIEQLPAPIYHKTALSPKHAATRTAAFRDATLAAGIHQPHIQRSEQLSGLHESLGGAACAFDANNDGWVDLLTLNGSGTTHFFGKPKWWQQNKNSLTLYVNNRDGTFYDHTQASLLDTQTWTMGCTTGDIDNDGDSDIVITTIGENQLWQNQGDGSFSPVEKSSGFMGEYWSTSASLIDVNRDDLLDIYINNYIDFTTNSLTFEATSGFENTLAENFNAALFNGQANQLFINQGNWQFTDKAAELGIDNPQGRSLFSRWLDINYDGYHDVIIANGKGASNKVFLNRQGKIFEDISVDSRLSFVDHVSAVGVGDFNNDGINELFFATDQQLFPRVYSPQQYNPPNSQNVTAYIDLADDYHIPQNTTINQTHWGHSINDVNLDGTMDLLLANGLVTPNSNTKKIARGQPNTLLINQANQTLLDHSHLLAPHTYSSDASRCAISADFDNNGSPDFFIANNNGLGQLLNNTIEGHQWIGLQFDAHDAISKGAKVTLTIKNKESERHLYQTYGNYDTFLCQGDSRLLFGLGALEQHAQLTITVQWPDNTRQTFSNLEKNHYYTVRQADNAITKTEYISKPQQSHIRLDNTAHKRQVIGWLIQHQKMDLAVKELRLLLQHNDTQVRLGAAHTINALPSYAQIPLIQIAISDSSRDVQLAAVSLIRNNEDERLTRWLIKKLDSDHVDIACAVADSLAYFYDEEEALIIGKRTAISPLIRLALQESHQASLCAIDALGWSENYRALRPLLSLLQSKSSDVRLHSAQALGLLKERAAINGLTHVAQSVSEEVSVRAAALISMKQIVPQYDIEAFIHQSNDESNWQAVLHYAYLNADSNILIRREIKPLLEEAVNVDPIAVPFQPTELVNESVDCHSSSIVVTEKIIQHWEVFMTCLSEDKIYRTTPQWITRSLTRSERDFSSWVGALSQRSEAWADRIIINQLNHASVTTTEKIAILKALPIKLPTDLKRQLQTLLYQAPDSTIAPYLARFIDKNTEPETTEILFELLAQFMAIQSPEEASAVASGLVNVFPDRVFALVLKDEAHHEP